MKKPEETKKALALCVNANSYNYPCDECPYVEEDEGCKNMMEDALALIQKLEAQVPKWISVEDRLPEAKLAVLAYGRRHIRKTETTELPAPHVAYTRGEDEGWFTWDYGDYVYVSHWMPLPEPPEEETGHV